MVPDPIPSLLRRQIMTNTDNGGKVSARGREILVDTGPLASLCRHPFRTKITRPRASPDPPEIPCHMTTWFRLTSTVTACAGLLFAVACGSSPSAPSSQPAYSQIDLQVGTGATAAAGITVSVNYTGWLYDSTRTDSKGTQFDSSLSAGRQPYVFVVGGTGTIQGFSQGVTGMRVGGSRRVVLPSSLAYGTQGSGSIPPNTPLVFDITLLSVQ
jgi:FKBP-type peptidyl-prolyl cis-trans isomerase FkpA